MVNPAPIANAGNDATVYYGYTPMSCTNLAGSATGGTPAYTFTWSTGATGSAINVCPTATSTYTLTATDSKGCKSTSNITVNVVDVRCGNKNDKVKVCHTEAQKHANFLCVDDHAVPAHLAHGDYVGECHVTYTRAALPINIETVYEKINVYPNPSNGNFNIKLPGVKEEVTITILNANGGTLLRKKVRGNHNNLIAFHLPNVAKGVYIVQVFADNKMHTSKLIIQ